jgi:hypothetical protein
MQSKHNADPPENCPNCGADVPPGARACPECGADEATGWSEEAVVGGLGLPDEEGFDYDDFVQREFGGGKRRHHGLRPGWWWVGVLLLVIFFTLFLMRLLSR